jgi:hypothetical protein
MDRALCCPTVRLSSIAHILSRPTVLWLVHSPAHCRMARAVSRPLSHGPCPLLPHCPTLFHRSYSLLPTVPWTVPSAAPLSDSICSITTLSRALNNVPEETAKHVKRYHYDTLYHLATSLKLDKIDVAKAAEMLMECACDSKLIKLAQNDDQNAKDNTLVWIPYPTYMRAVANGLFGEQ